MAVAAAVGRGDRDFSITMPKRYAGPTLKQYLVDTLRGGAKTLLATSFASACATAMAASASSTTTSYPSPKVLPPSLLGNLVILFLLKHF